MNQAYVIIKEELKALGQKIGKQKLERKEQCRKGTSTWKIDANIEANKKEFRHKHIARCLLKGLDYAEIEQPHKNNKPDWYAIDEYKSQYEKLYTKYTVDTEIRIEHTDTKEAPCEAICVA